MYKIYGIIKDVAVKKEREIILYHRLKYCTKEIFKLLTIITVAFFIIITIAFTFLYICIYFFMPRVYEFYKVNSVKSGIEELKHELQVDEDIDIDEPIYIKSLNKVYHMIVHFPISPENEAADSIYN